jgi:cytochrome c553
MRFWLALLISLPLTAADERAKTPEYFETKIRPLLASNCYACHTNTQMGGLRLDSRAAILKGGASGPAIVPGDPGKSRMIERVRHNDEKMRMPMGGQLKAEEIAALAAWIEAGAPWPESVKTAQAQKASRTGEFVIAPEQRNFWSFRPLARPAIPAVKDAAWAKTDIDRFILARLEGEGLRPVAMADKRTLLRRATLDLTGLPPTAEDVEAFEKDASPGAFAKVVDRLLASPHYGERWGRWWLDVARYGEDDYRSLDPKRRGMNPYPNAFHYRDWVIRAFNDDLPYDQFVKAQLAADLMDEKARPRMLPALGFLGLGPWYYDNGAVEITRADERHDRVDAVSRGFLGLTVACARCHDHKYDPVPTRDYYALAGVFANTVYHEYPLVPKAIVDEQKKLEKLIENKEKLLGEFMSTERNQLAESLALQAAKYMRAAWKVTGEPKEDLARVADDEKLDYELLDRWVKFLAKPPKFYPYLTAWQKMIAKGGSPAEARKLAEQFQTLLLDVMFARKEIKEENEIIEAKALPGTKKKKKANLPNEFITNDDFCPGCGLELKSLPVEQNNLWTDVFQRDLADGFDPAQATERFRPGLLVFNGWSLEKRLSAERLEYIRALRVDLEALRKSATPKFPYLHAVTEAEKPGNLQLALRGSPTNLGPEVPRGFLTVLSQTPAPFKNGSGRLELAERIIAQPLAMRVIVNRIWKGHFGAGLVDTPSNFGVTGERPTHPELLDYLAGSFLANGMSMKKLHREILLSAVYQLSHENSPENALKDAGNRLYWQASRRRLDAEQIRDSMLFVSGALDAKIGGPSGDLTPGYTRRTVYARISRYRLDEYLQLFDFPSPNFSSEKRHITTVPLQRLFFMNSDFVQRQAEAVARLVSEEGDPAERIRKIYRLLFARAPSEAELRAGLDFVTTEPMRAYEERRAAAKEKAPETAEEGMDGGKDNPELALEDLGPPPADAMMAGVSPNAARAPKEKPVPVTHWGRYVKILLSSVEFLSQ